MAIISLTAAKHHLRITTTAHDVDVAMKLAQAEAIIFDYLKTRYIAIESVEAANPAIVTTTVPHSLVSGATYTLTDTETTPTINGAQVVTVTSATTFTVPVNVTAGQDEELGVVGAATFTDLTAPRVIESAVLLTLTHVYENRGDDMRLDEHFWGAITRLLARQRDPALA